MRRAISFKFALVADRETAVVAVPLRGTLTGIWCHASSPILAFLVTDRGAAVLARPLRGTGTSIRSGTIAAVAARSSTNGRRTIRVEPAVLALARVRRDALAPVRALLDA